MVLSAFAAASCNRGGERVTGALAIAPFENLTGDSSLNWVGLAVSSLVSNGAGVAAIGRVADATGAGAGAGAARLLHV